MWSSVSMIRKFCQILPILQAFPHLFWQLHDNSNNEHLAAFLSRSQQAIRLQRADVFVISGTLF